MVHSAEFLAIVEEVRPRVREVSVVVTLERVKNGAILIDVREDYFGAIVNVCVRLLALPPA